MMRRESQPRAREGRGDALVCQKSRGTEIPEGDDPEMLKKVALPFDQWETPEIGQKNRGQIIQLMKKGGPQLNGKNLLLPTQMLEGTTALIKIVDFKRHRESKKKSKS